MFAEWNEGPNAMRFKGYETGALEELLPTLAHGAGDKGDEEDEDQRLDHGDGEQVLEAGA